MPEPRSVLGARYAPGRQAGAADPGVTLCELTGWDLLQAAAWRGRFEALCGQVGGALDLAPPDSPGRCETDGEVEIITAAPLRLWCIAPADSERLGALADAIDADTGCVTELGHSHTRIRLHGRSVRPLLMQEIAIDLDPRTTTTGDVMRTGFHHVPVTLQCIDADAEVPTFDLYLPTTFAASSWEYLLDLATPCGCEVLERRPLVEE